MTPELVPLPDTGRVFRGHRRVRLAEVDPDGRARLDAVARWLQDVARDDARDAGLAGADFWVVRRTTIVVDTMPRFDEELDLATFCGGVGPRWAERRTSIRGHRGGSVETASLWVCLDPDTLRPARLSDQFRRVWAEAADDRRVGARLRHDRPDRGDGHHERPWPIRHADLDVLGHVNNAVVWTAVDDELHRCWPTTVVRWAEVEHPAEITDGTALTLLGRGGRGRLSCWLLSDESVHASAVVSLAE